MLPLLFALVSINLVIIELVFLNVTLKLLPIQERVMCTVRMSSGKRGSIEETERYSTKFKKFHLVWWFGANPPKNEYSMIYLESKNLHGHTAWNSVSDSFSYMLVPPAMLYIYRPHAVGLFTTPACPFSSSSSWTWYLFILLLPILLKVKKSKQWITGPPSHWRRENLLEFPQREVR